jgi:hypothetical protein
MLEASARKISHLFSLSSKPILRFFKFLRLAGCSLKIMQRFKALQSTKTHKKARSLSPAATSL